MSDVPGFHVTKALGAVYGLTVRSAGLTTVVASIAGGELESFTNMLYSARNDAMSRIINETQSRGGNAIVALRFDSTDLGNGIAQICAYGTAVVLEKASGDQDEHPQPSKAES